MHMAWTLRISGAHDVGKCAFLGGFSRYVFGG